MSRSPRPLRPLAGGSLFGAVLGKPVVKPVVSSIVPDHAAAPAHCPRCGGALVTDQGLWRCTGRCGRRWLATADGRWLDPATLPLGVCQCCEPRAVLVAAECGAICPQSHVEYVVLPEGIRPRHTAAPDGICRCCLPPQPLVRSGEVWVCRAKPQQHYMLAGDQVVWQGSGPPLDQAAVTAAIDAALSANAAQLSVYGLFVPNV